MISNLPQCLLSIYSKNLSRLLDFDLGGALQILAGMSQVTVYLRLVRMRHGNTVDLCTTNYASCDWELRASTHQVGVDLACTLATLVDSPEKC